MRRLTAGLVLRGIKTLGIRMDRSRENAMEIAKMAESTEACDKGHLSGFEDHPGHKDHETPEPRDTAQC